MPTVPMLRELLRARGLPTEGYSEKSEMLAVLAEAGLPRSELDALDAREANARESAEQAAAVAAALALQEAAEAGARKAYARKLKGALADHARNDWLPPPRALPAGLVRSLVSDDDSVPPAAPSASTTLWEGMLLCSAPVLPALRDLGLAAPSLAALGLAPANRFQPLHGGGSRAYPGHHQENGVPEVGHHRQLGVPEVGHHMVWGKQ
ncbi:hypothetical protein T492DRAFT_833243 [Pavlovales sp. CCMP2436]|nr:hypothetical protein T492DRAFT_833243 [Pavlovales sp. CCMP2436]